MADNLQTKVAKLVKYGNGKFGLSETTLRGVLDNASGSENLDTELNTQDSLLADLEDNINNLPPAGSDVLGEVQPNPTWWDIKKILDEDTTTGYNYKTILLLNDNNDTATTPKFGLPNALAVKSLMSTITGTAAMRTSDGKFYENITTDTVHTWDTTKDKPSLYNGEEIYKTRYVILYYNDELTIILAPSGGSQLILSAYGDLRNSSSISLVEFSNVEFIDINCPNVTGFGTYSTNIKSVKLKNATSLTSINCSRGSLRELVIEGATNVTSLTLTQCSLFKLGDIDFQNITSSPTIRMLGVLRTINKLHLPKVETVNYLFERCPSLKEIKDIYLKPVSFNSPFRECISLIRVGGVIDLINTTNTSVSVSYCYRLEDITFKNIQCNLLLSSSSNTYSFISVNTILNTIKELWITDSTKTLSLYNAKNNIANVYVKLIDITDEMRAEDEYIDNKKPFVVCESTDVGAMTIEEYVTSKGWTLA